MAVRPLVDGEDILAEVFTEGPGEDPQHLLPPDGPLTAGAEPREVRLAEARCTEGCCGAVYVTIQRIGDQVIWGGWRDPRASEIDLPEFRFDAREYHAEVERAVADHSWELPALTVARLLKQDLEARTDWFAQWDCEFGAVSAFHWEPEQVNVLFFHPGRVAIAENRPWLQFQMVLAVSSDDPEGQSARLAEHIVASDPTAGSRGLRRIKRSLPGNSAIPGHGGGEAERGNAGEHSRELSVQSRSSPDSALRITGCAARGARRVGVRFDAVRIDNPGEAPPPPRSW